MGEGRTAISLEGLCPHGWLEELSEKSQAFEQLCRILGRELVASSIVAGVQIRALTVDRLAMNESLVTFALVPSSVDETKEEDVKAQTDFTLRIPEFGDRIMSILLAKLDHYELRSDPVVNQASADTIEDLLGAEVLLLAPVFGLDLRELHLNTGAPHSVVVEERVTGALRRDLGAGKGLGKARRRVEELSLPELRRTMRSHLTSVLASLERSRQRTVIEPTDVDQARELLAAGHYEQVVQLLSAWPSVLGSVLRSPALASVSEGDRSVFSEGLRVLGRALSGQREHELAAEVFRLAVYWAGDSGAAGNAYFELARAVDERGEPAQALGLYQSAFERGAPAADVLPALARAMLDTGRTLEAFSVALAALRRGVAPEALSAVVEPISAQLDAAWEPVLKHAPEWPKLPATDPKIEHPVKDGTPSS